MSVKKLYKGNVEWIGWQQKRKKESGNTDIDFC